MALSGNLGFVPLDEVLRLLTRSDQQGAIDVWGQDVRGRIFISKKGIGLATISDDKELRRHLVNSGYVDEAYLNSIEAGSTTLAPLADKEADIIDLLREMTVESLYQMSRRGSSFEVTESTTHPLCQPKGIRARGHSGRVEASGRGMGRGRTDHLGPRRSHQDEP